MRIKWIGRILLFVVLILLQIWIFNQIHLFGVAVPMAYIYFLLKLPSNTNRNFVLLLAFLQGLFIDIFSYTLGMHALASTLAGFMWYYSLKLFSSRDMPDEYIPSVNSLGPLSFLKYAGSIVLLHLIVFFVVETASVFDPLNLILRTFSSFLLTMIIIFGFEGFNLDFRKR